MATRDRLQWPVIPLIRRFSKCSKISKGCPRRTTFCHMRTRWCTLWWVKLMAIRVGRPMRSSPWMVCSKGRTNNRSTFLGSSTIWWMTSWTHVHSRLLWTVRIWFKTVKVCLNCSSPSSISTHKWLRILCKVLLLEHRQCIRNPAWFRPTFSLTKCKAMLIQCRFNSKCCRPLTRLLRFRHLNQ